MHKSASYVIQHETYISNFIFIRRLDRREPQPPKVSCLDIEEPVFAVSPKAQKDYTQTGITKDVKRNNFKGLHVLNVETSNWYKVFA